MAKHTGGLPWTAIPNEWDEVLPEEDRGNDWYVLTANEVAIAVGLYKPDAYLIAAAPDLLAACKRLVELVTDYDPRAMLDGDEAMRDRYIAAWRDMRAAIRKAERS